MARSKRDEAETPVAAMKIEQWSIDRPIPYARNARKIPAEAIDRVAASIKEFGWQQPIVCDGEDVVVIGHTRLLAAKKLSMTHVPVHIATGLSAAQIKALRIMDNKSHEATSWDKELLSIELGDLNVNNFDLTLTGFDLEELGTFLIDDAGPDDIPANDAASDSDKSEAEEKESPSEFKSFDENIATDHECPKCGYKWSGGK